MRLSPAALPLAALSSILVFAADVAAASSFRLGEQITGSINFPGDEDTATFEVIAGSKVRFRVESLAGDGVQWTVIDPDGQAVSKLSGAVEPGKKKKVKAKALKSGTYEIRFTGLSGQSTGVYHARTKVKLPGSSKSKKKGNVKPKKGQPEAVVTFSGLTDGSLTLQITPKKFGGSPMTLSLVNPAGNEMFSSSLSQSTVVVQDLPLPLSGSYQLRLTGFPTKKAGAAVKITLDQPVGDKNSIVQIDG